MSMVSTDGTQCNMVGTSYYAFKYAQVVHISPTNVFWWELAGFDTHSFTVILLNSACKGPSCTSDTNQSKATQRAQAVLWRGLLWYGPMEVCTSNPKQLLCMQSPCSQPASSCLQNQLTDLYAADVTRSTKGVTPIYFISRWGGGKAGAQQVVTAA